MEVLIKVSSSEFDEEVVKTINSFLKGREAEITITVRDARNANLLNETPEQYINRIHQSTKEIDEGEAVTFTMQELEDFINK